MRHLRPGLEKPAITPMFCNNGVLRVGVQIRMRCHPPANRYKDARNMSMQDHSANPDQDNAPFSDASTAQSVHASSDGAVDSASEANEQSAALAESQAALAEAQAQNATLKDEFLRAKAETENVRRRGQDDVSKAHKFAIESFAEHLLPVMDSLEAALAAEAADPAKLREGVELTLRQLTSALEKGRVTAIQPAIGEKFDPHRHQAISMVPADQAPDTVVTVLQKGFVIAERVLRPALVMVAAPK
jgi:molecular chaperone GrpE